MQYFWKDISKDLIVQNVKSISDEELFKKYDEENIKLNKANKLYSKILSKSSLESDDKLFKSRKDGNFRK